MARAAMLLLACSLATASPMATTGVPSQTFDTLFAAGSDLGLQPLAGRKALITGASSGIGKATACALAACGVDLILVARREARLVEIADEIARRDLGVDVTMLVGDVAADEELYAKLDQIAASEGAPDIVIANAGGALGKANVGEEELSDVRTMMDVNVFGAIRTVRTLLPSMLANQKGHVMFIGSIAGLEAYEGGSSYCAAKAAIHAFAKALRYETYGSGVRVTNVAPGFVGEGTEFAAVRMKGDDTKAAATYAGFDELRATDIACQLLWALRQPDRVNVDLLHVMPSSQGVATRIKRVLK